ncbi:MAG: methyltransferase domain-containing protein [Flavobacteriaceae bacterium]|nr:methyltransferase domain-containing protein [Flavobacteriaceae bacterium]
MFDFPETNSRLAVSLLNRGEKRVRIRHPWIFDRHIERIKGEGKAGDLAMIFSSEDNKLMGIGLYDPDSPIRIKMLHHGPARKIDESFFREKVEQAFEKRKELLQTDTNSYRFIFGENDGFPGLIADVYAHVMVLKVYSEIWLPWLNSFIGFLIETSGCDAVVLRLSRIMQKSMKGKLADGQVIYGELDQEEVLFKEHGLKFSANVFRGHKTGYFLDHRHNRKRVGELSKGKKVLDVFAYSGGFSVHALTGGANEVTSVDISGQALEQAKRNSELNAFEGLHHCIKGDAFNVLTSLIDEGHSYDLVVIDPPSFAKQESEIALALKKYRQLAQLGQQLIIEGGILILASCSSRVKSDSFFEAVEEELDMKQFSLKERTFHDSDHPISFPEGAYLKCSYYHKIY